MEKEKILVNDLKLIHLAVLNNFPVVGEGIRTPTVACVPV